MVKWLIGRNDRKAKVNERLSEGEVYVIDSDNVSLTSLSLARICEGNYYVKDQITVEVNGHVKGAIFSHDAIIRGQVSGGQIVCTGVLTIASTAVVKGRVVAQAVLLEPGAVLNGSLEISENVTAPELADRIEKGRRAQKAGKGSETSVQHAPSRLVRDEVGVANPVEGKRETRTSSPVSEPDAVEGNWW